MEPVNGHISQLSLENGNAVLITSDPPIAEILVDVHAALSYYVDAKSGKDWDALVRLRSLIQTIRGNDVVARKEGTVVFLQV